MDFLTKGRPAKFEYRYLWAAQKKVKVEAHEDPFLVNVSATPTV